MIQVCSGITSGRVLNGELYAQILQKLIYLHLLTGCFMKISLQSSKQNLVANVVFGKQVQKKIPTPHTALLVACLSLKI